MISTLVIIMIVLVAHKIAVYSVSNKFKMVNEQHKRERKEASKYTTCKDYVIRYIDRDGKIASKSFNCSLDDAIRNVKGDAGCILTVE
jgi:hypothetical protein